MDNKVWVIIGIISAIVLLSNIQGVGSPDKKTADAAQVPATLGAVGLASALTFGIKKQVVWLGLAGGIWKIIIWPLTALIAFLPNMFGNFVNIFKPQPTIPIWVWVVGVFVLVIFFMSRKKR